MKSLSVALHSVRRRCEGCPDNDNECALYLVIEQEPRTLTSGLSLHIMEAFRRPRIRFIRAVPASMIATILVMLRQPEFAAVGWSGIPGNQTLHVCRRDYIQTTARDAGLRVRLEAASGTRSKHLNSLRV